MMSNYYSTRTVRTYVSDGSGRPKVETKTYTLGGPGSSSLGFTPSSDFSDFSQKGFGDFGGQFNIDFGDSFGGRGLDFDIKGGRLRPSISTGGRGGGSRPSPSSRSGGGAGPKLVSLPDSDPQPKLAGRPTRTLKKNPFVSLKLQNFDQIRTQCKQQGILFEDPEFPCVDSSIFFSRPPPRPFEWKRPHVSTFVEIVVFFFTPRRQRLLCSCCLIVVFLVCSCCMLRCQRLLCS